MKNIILSFFLLALISSGCESSVEIVNESIGETGAITGTITYQEILSEHVFSENSEIIAEIKANTSESIPREVSRISNGSVFEFGPLPYGKYDINFKLEDSLTGILYKNRLNGIKLSKNSVSLFRKVELFPKDQTVIIARVTTPDDRPVTNAKVFLYNDSTLLKTYLGAAGFVDSGVTNNFGKAAFVNHAPGDYYLYPILIIEEDTLRRDLTNLVPQYIPGNTLSELTVELKLN